MNRSSIKSRSNAAGFTLIEALVALVLVAVSLTAIGSVVATNIRATQALGQRLALVETMRAILADLPDREQIVSGDSSGEFANHRWRVEILPFAADFIDPRRANPWSPQLVVVKMRSPGGRVLQIDTLRLHRDQGSRK